MVAPWRQVSSDIRVQQNRLGLAQYDDQNGMKPTVSRTAAFNLRDNDMSGNSHNGLAQYGGRGKLVLFKRMTRSAWQSTCTFRFVTVP